MQYFRDFSGHKRPTQTHRPTLALHVLVFVSYCQNAEIFVYLWSVNYHPLIIYRNLYQFNLLIERTKRSPLHCTFSQVEQIKKDAKGRKGRNYFSSSLMLNESWNEYKRENQPMGWLLLTKVFGGRNLTWKQLLFPRWWLRTIAFLVSLLTVSVCVGSSNQDRRGRRSLTC